MTAARAFFLLLAGAVGGVLGGMGLGGGTLLIPLLTVALSVPSDLAAWLNLVSFIPMSLIALAIHLKHKLVSVGDAVFLAIPALFGAVTGSLFLREMIGNIGKIAFGWFLISLGVFSLAVGLIRGLKKR